MGVFSATVTASLVTRLGSRGVNGTNMGLNELSTYVGAVAVSGGPEAPVVNSSGTVTLNGNALTNQQVQELYEMLF